MSSPHGAARFLPALALLAACGRLDAVEDLADPVVAQGIYLGLDVPESFQDDLAEAEGFEYAALCNVFLAYLSDPSELANAPVEGATIKLRSPANGTLTFREAEDTDGNVVPGKYTLDSTDGLVYEAGDAPVISFEQDGEEARLQVSAPEAPEVETPGVVEREETVVVDLSAYDYQNAVAASYDLDRSTLRWTNLPESVDDTYAFTHDEGPIDSILMPGEAFLRKGPHVVGVAGMEIADPNSFSGVNTTLSAFLAGRLTVRLVSVTE
ncbi:MAG: hypothetical protein ACK4YP_05950 [Myxococcota bacterium]